MIINLNVHTYTIEKLAYPSRDIFGINKPILLYKVAPPIIGDTTFDFGDVYLPFLQRLQEGSSFSTWYALNQEEIIASPSTTFDFLFSEPIQEKIFELLVHDIPEDSIFQALVCGLQLLVVSDKVTIDIKKNIFEDDEKFQYLDEPSRELLFDESNNDLSMFEDYFNEVDDSQFKFL